MPPTRVVLSDYYLLVLGEPTNHLDAETQDVLPDALAGFPGAVLFVSRDRRYLETLAIGALYLPPLHATGDPGLPVEALVRPGWGL